MRRAGRVLAVLVAATLFAACGSASRSAPAPAAPAAVTTAQTAPAAAPIRAAAPTVAASTRLATSPPLNRKPVARKPVVTPCSGNTSPQLIRVSIAAQHLWMCAGAVVARDTAVTTGLPTDDYHTPTGSYTVQALATHQTLTLLSGDQYVVDYWIPFDAPLFGFHDAAWQTFPFGSPQYRTDGSHGCVHMPLAAIAFLYGWVTVGTPVAVT